MFTSVGVLFIKISQCKQLTAVLLSTAAAFHCAESNPDSLEEVGIGLVGSRDVNLHC